MQLTKYLYHQIDYKLHQTHFNMLMLVIYTTVVLNMKTGSSKMSFVKKKKLSNLISIRQTYVFHLIRIKIYTGILKKIPHTATLKKILLATDLASDLIENDKRLLVHLPPLLYFKLPCNVEYLYKLFSRKIFYMARK